jgi:hypothetical protein
VYKAWDTFARDYGLDAAHVAHATHGRRLYDTLKEWCRIEDEAKLQVRRQERGVRARAAPFLMRRFLRPRSCGSRTK